MKSRPIQFDKKMVTRLLEGVKKQHRFPVEIPESYKDLFTIAGDFCAETVDIECPLGVVGDELWVRENWGYHGGSSGGMEDRHCLHIKYKADEHDEYNEIHFKNSKKMSAAMPNQTGYKSPVDCDWMDEDEGNDHYREYINKWWEAQTDKPEDTMPRWASRILLEITDIRTERLRDIDDKGAKTEGCKEWKAQKEWVEKLNRPENYYNGFHSYWDEVYARTQYSWASNPLVWVVEFKTKQIRDNRKRRKTNTKNVAGKKRASRR